VVVGFFFFLVGRFRWWVVVFLEVDRKLFSFGLEFLVGGGVDSLGGCWLGHQRRANDQTISLRRGSRNSGDENC